MTFFLWHLKKSNYRSNSSPEEKQGKVCAIRCISWLSSGGNVYEELDDFFQKMLIPERAFSLCLLLTTPVILRDPVAYNDIIIYFGKLLICYEWKILDQSLWVIVILKKLPIFGQWTLWRMNRNWFSRSRESWDQREIYLKGLPRVSKAERFHQITEDFFTCDFLKVTPSILGNDHLMFQDFTLH